MLSYPKIFNQGRIYVEHPSKEMPTDWCCDSLRFDEPDNSGPFSTAGKEYIREPLNSFANQDVQERIFCWGSQSGKTGLLMGAAAWLSVCIGTRIFWVMPTLDLARKFSRKRLMKMLRASIGTRGLIPTGGQSRHDFKTLEMEVGQSVIDLTGSNSMANLKSTPARCIFQDEIDEFKVDDKNPNPVDAADERSKGQANPIKVKASTPKIYEGLAWQFLLKSDLRRRFVPCPFCAKMVLFIFNQQYSILPTQGCEASVVWDKEARRDNGTWDLDRVERSARFECPFCHGHIRDTHKTKMDRLGEWRTTQVSSRGSLGWQLPSFYSCSPETATGKIAVKFLEKKNSLLGLQSIINGYFAEPYMAQDLGSERKERITERLEVTDAPVMIQTVDCQEKSPYFWTVVRQWKRNITSVGIVATSADSWEDLEALQKANGVKDVAFGADSGFGAKSEAEVYRACASHGELENRPGQLPVHVGWIPMKGMPGTKRWMDKETKLNNPFRLWPIDPYTGTEFAKRAEMNLLEFSSGYFHDILEVLRKNSDRWSVLKEVATEEYWRHIDGAHKIATINKRNGITTHTWMKRGRWWPDHLRDAEIMQLVMGAFFELYKLE